MLLRSRATSHFPRSVQVERRSRISRRGTQNSQELPLPVKISGRQVKTSRVRRVCVCEPRRERRKPSGPRANGAALLVPTGYNRLVELVTDCAPATRHGLPVVDPKPITTILAGLPPPSLRPSSYRRQASLFSSPSLRERSCCRLLPRGEEKGRVLLNLLKLDTLVKLTIVILFFSDFVYHLTKISSTATYYAM